jgi:hypothetical protein
MNRNYSIRILRGVCGAIIYVMIGVMLVAYFFKHMVDIDIDDALYWTEKKLREMVHRIKKLKGGKK